MRNKFILSRECSFLQQISNVSPEDRSHFWWQLVVRVFLENGRVVGTVDGQGFRFVNFFLDLIDFDVIFLLERTVLA